MSVSILSISISQNSELFPQYNSHLPLHKIASIKKGVWERWSITFFPFLCFMQPNMPHSVTWIYTLRQQSKKSTISSQRLTACACLIKSRISSFKAWCIFAGPLSSHKQTACTSLENKDIRSVQKNNSELLNPVRFRNKRTPQTTCLIK